MRASLGQGQGSWKGDKGTKPRDTERGRFSKGSAIHTLEVGGEVPLNADSRPHSQTIEGRGVPALITLPVMLEDTNI